MISNKDHSKDSVISGALLANPESFDTALRDGADSGSPSLKSLACQILEFREGTAENEPSHMMGAIDALKAFLPGTILHRVGFDATDTLMAALKRKAVVMIVGDMANIEEHSNYISMTLQSYVYAQLKGGIGKTHVFADEVANFNASQIINKLPVIRAYGGCMHFYTQSRAGLAKRFSDKVATSVDENCAQKVYLTFSNTEEAERVSKACGEDFVRNSSMSIRSDAVGFNDSLSLTRGRLVSAAELNAMPKHRLLFNTTGIGWYFANRISQHQISPFAELLAPNHLEANNWKPDIKLKLYVKGFRP